MLDTRPVCLSRMTSLARGGYQCARCGWPLCSAACARADIHSSNVSRVQFDVMSSWIEIHLFLFHL